MPRQARNQAHQSQLWDLKKYKIRIDLPGHTDEVYCVDFVADKVVSGGRDKTVKMSVLTPFHHQVLTYFLQLAELRPVWHVEVGTFGFMHALIHLFEQH